MIAGLLSALLLLRPEAVGAEALLAAGLVAAVLLVAVALGAVAVAPATRTVPATSAFATLRVLLRASDPAAAGHHRARAPGTLR